MGKEKEIKYSVTPQDYLATFSSSSGARVLTHLLAEFGFFEEADTEEERIQRNIMIRLLRNMGVFQKKNFQVIAGAFVNIANAYPLKIREENNDGRE